MDEDINLKGKRALIIEDEAIFRKLLSDSLLREGFEILEAADGYEGLETALREKPDVILLDLILPAISGVEIMKKVRAAGEWGKSAPIVIFTNLDPDDPLMHEIAKNEPSFYLMKKDQEIGDVVLKVRECFRKKR